MKTEKHIYGKETKRSTNNRLRQSPEGESDKEEISSSGRRYLHGRNEQCSGNRQAPKNGEETNLSRDDRRVSQKDNNRLTEHQQRVAKHVDEPLQTDLEII